MDKSRVRAGTDQAWPQAISFNLGIGSAGQGEVLWRCEGSRGGRVYTSGLFGSRQEAEDFASKLRQVEPDQSFNVEEIKASAIWN